jgi:hypothetical protein
MIHLLYDSHEELPTYGVCRACARACAHSPNGSAGNIRGYSAVTDEPNLQRHRWFHKSVSDHNSYQTEMDSGPGCCCNTADYSEGLRHLLEDVDPGAFYRTFFNSGFFPNPHRIATGCYPTRQIETLHTMVESCVDATDQRLPLAAIRGLFGWKETLQSVAEHYMRTGGRYASIEETFLNQVAFETGYLLRDLFDTYDDFRTMIDDPEICDHVVRLLHLLWILRGIARQCDVLIQEYCIQQQIQTARERLELENTQW